MESVIVWLILVVIGWVVQTSAKRAKKSGKHQKQTGKGTNPIRPAIDGTGGVYIPKAPAAPVPKPTAQQTMDDILVAMGMLGAGETAGKTPDDLFAGSMRAPETEGKTIPAFEPAPVTYHSVPREGKGIGADGGHEHPASPFTRMTPQVGREDTGTLTVLDEADVPASAPSMHLNFEPVPLLNAIVLQEVLTRPGQRRRPGMRR